MVSWRVETFSLPTELVQPSNCFNIIAIISARAWLETKCSSATTTWGLQDWQNTKNRIESPFPIGAFSGLLSVSKNAFTAGAYSVRSYRLYNWWWGGSSLPFPKKPIGLMIKPKNPSPLSADGLEFRTFGPQECRVQEIFLATPMSCRPRAGKNLGFGKSF